MKIERTYRNSQQLIDIAGKFVMQNPSQFRKDLLSDKSMSQPIQVMGYKKEAIVALKRAIADIAEHSGSSSEIMLLGRNNFDVNFIDQDDEFEKKVR
ncbi:hypothetical protein OMP38_03205 [Cohnella ginsengisoli]|uniref:Uncharacterized protein n=1 Tax=Cohnella ginsengisoli TaxID=425004 RepID=A0A9X4KDE4_9BACL|nr:hypothetical protein [Cohnella ginsengisoli]MDG0789971.1 hypothetical protein [Cohnella ginsengisoli]